MASLRKQISKLQAEAHKYVTWLVGSLFGEDSITEEEAEELHGTLSVPPVKPVDISRRAYVLGRANATLGDSAYKDAFGDDDDFPLSTEDELAITAARLHGARYVRNLALDMVDGAFAELESSLSREITEDLVRTKTREAVSESVRLQETIAQLQSRLATIFGPKSKRNLMKVAETEIHAAKQAGVAMAILMKRGPYKDHGGPDAKVIVTPSAGACSDCKNLYTRNGEPIVFRLGDLYSRRSNGEPGTSHKRKDGLHTNWKATVPPLHPTCFCTLRFVPEGAKWVNGKFRVEKSHPFAEDMAKAQYGGVAGVISSKVKPKGPGHKPKEKGLGSGPGFAGMNHKPGPGRPKGTSDSPASVSVSLEKYTDCPYGGGRACIEAGGNGEPQHLTTGRISKLHQEFAAKAEEPADPSDQQNLVEDGRSKAWSSVRRKQKVILAALEEAPISGSVDFDAGPSGRTSIVSLSGAGRALVLGNGSPSTPRDGSGCGIGTVPLNGMARREVAAFVLSEALGFGVVPPTVLRPHQGHEHSFQHMEFTSKQVCLDIGVSGSPTVYDALLNVGMDKYRDSRKKDLHTIAVFDAVLNSQNRTPASVVVSKRGDAIQAIGNRYGFGNGMFGHSNPFLMAIASRGRGFNPSIPLMKRLALTSYQDVVRALGSLMQPWEIAQTFLRIRYVVMLFVAHKTLPKQCFLETVSTATGAELPVLLDHKDHVPSWPGKTLDEKLASFNTAVRNGTTPGHLFLRFAKAFVYAISADPQHPDYAFAQAMLASPPFLTAAQVESGETRGAGVPWEAIEGDYSLTEMEPV